MTDPNEISKNDPVLKKLDQFVYGIEQVIVSICAVVMTVSVSLDILYRSLKGIQSNPTVFVLDFFGIFSKETQNLPTSVLPLILYSLGIFGFGYAVSASMSRHLHLSAQSDENNNQSDHQANHQHDFAKNSKWGIFSLFAFYFLSVMVLHLPSYVVITMLWVVILGLIAFKHFQEKAYVDLGVKFTFLVIGVFLTLKAPQDYIWSQELSLILLSWVYFLGASMATYQNKHIQLGALAGALPEKIKPYSYALGLMVTAIFCAYLDFLVLKGIFGKTGAFFNGELRPATQIPAYVILMSSAVAFSLMSIRLFFYSVDAFIHPRLPEEVLH